MSDTKTYVTVLRSMRTVSEPILKIIKMKLLSFYPVLKRFDEDIDVSEAHVHLDYRR